MTELLAILRKIHAEHGAWLHLTNACLAMLREDAPTKAQQEEALDDAIRLTGVYDALGDPQRGRRACFAGACAHLHSDLKACGNALRWYFHFTRYSGPEVEIAWAYKDGLKP